MQAKNSCPSSTILVELGHPCPSSIIIAQVLSCGFVQPSFCVQPPITIERRKPVQSNLRNDFMQTIHLRKSPITFYDVPSRMLNLMTYLYPSSQIFCHMPMANVYNLTNVVCVLFMLCSSSEFIQNKGLAACTTAAICCLHVAATYNTRQLPVALLKI